MKKWTMGSLGIIALFFQMGCPCTSTNQEIWRVGMSGDYPPFEYRIGDKLTGFDVELATVIAGKLGRKVQLIDMQFSALLPALESKRIDAAISSVTSTEERSKKFDFSIPYFFDDLAMVFKKAALQENEQVQEWMKDKKIACQLGTTMHDWLKERLLPAFIVAMDSNSQAIEALKTGHVAAVLIDRSQAHVFAQKNPSLAYRVIEKAKGGYSVALSKNSPWLKEVNEAIESLKQGEEIEKLKNKWLGGD